MRDSKERRCRLPELGFINVETEMNSDRALDNLHECFVSAFRRVVDRVEIRVD